MSLINIGYDASGNGNNWTVNNLDYDTTSTGTDVMVDVPTNWGTDTGVGGEVRGNYCTLNPLFVNTTYPVTYSNGNLDATRAPGGQGGVTSTFGMSSGKWYWEVVFSTYAYNIGITTNPAGSTTGSEHVAGYNGGGGTSIGLQPSGVLRTNGTAGSTYTSWTTGDVMGIALDMDGGNLYFYKNGTAMNSGSPVATSLTGSTWFFITSLESGASMVANFGQRPFAYTAPSGFAALCTQNLPDPTIADGSQYFDVTLRNGFGSSGGSVTGVNFQPDFMWEKVRNSAQNHLLIDAVRGVTKELQSNTTAAESTGSNYLVSFNSNGMTFGSNDWSTGTTLVEWLWKAGGTGVSNTAGTITSTVSANPTAGFSIVTYTGNGTSGATVGHGLGAAPSMVIVKEREFANAWCVYHSSVGATKFLYLNQTDAATTQSDIWNDTAPTSTVFSVGNANATNRSTKGLVAYCFAPVDSYSAMGSYQGNGSTDGVFVYTGFRPRWIMVKRTDTTADWVLYDTERNTYNVATLALYPNLSNAEGTVNPSMDILSNGVKFRNLTSTFNASGGTYIYAAFAENPFKYSLAR